MDHKPIDALLSELESADPADAPPLADRIAAQLSEDLESDSDDGDDPAPPA
jgi:hypothetical protein